MPAPGFEQFYSIELFAPSSLPLRWLSPTLTLTLIYFLFCAFLLWLFPIAPFAFLASMQGWIISSSPLRLLFVTLFTTGFVRSPQRPKASNQNALRAFSTHYFSVIIFERRHFMQYIESVLDFKFGDGTHIAHDVIWNSKGEILPSEGSLEFDSIIASLYRLPESTWDSKLLRAAIYVKNAPEFESPLSANCNRHGLYCQRHVIQSFFNAQAQDLDASSRFDSPRKLKF
jgi:hypothetical protein